MTDRAFAAYRPLANSIRVRAATTANITIATALNAGDTLDGVTLADEMLVLVKDQSSAAENGIYVVGTVPRRYVDFSADIRGTTGAYDMHPGLIVAVEEGTTNADTLWLCTSNRGGTLGTTALVFSQLTPAGAGVAIDGFLYGLTLSNNVSDATNDIDIATGVAADATGARYMRLSSSLTKRLDATWAVGTNQGGLDTGAIANTTYHVWLIMRSDTGVVDALFSTSASAPTMPTGYDYKRRIGSIVRGGGAIRAFKQFGDQFMYPSYITDYSAIGNRVFANLTLSVPNGIVVIPMLSAYIEAVAGGNALLDVNDGDQTTGGSGRILQPGTGAFVSGSVAPVFHTNTAAQIAVGISDFGGADVGNCEIYTFGWIDTRGRLAP